MAKEKTCLYLDKDDLKKLKIISEVTGAPVAELVRRAIKKYLEKEKTYE
jgi:predicted DNA-binding protein